MSRSLVLLLIAVLVLSSLVMVGSAFAESIPTPSVPEFTLTLVAHPYDVPPTYETDPYTGETTMTAEGYHVENRSIEITISNQPFTIYKLDNTQYVDFYYNISYKGHYEDKWRYYSYNSNTNWFFRQSGSEYTVISFNQIPTEGQMDFRVQAQIGYYTEFYGVMGWINYNFTGEVSGWSETQTLTIPEIQTPSPSPEATSTPEPTSTPYSEPQSTEQTVILGLAVTVAVLGVGLGLLFYLIKRK
jgi:hypothetical protein